MAQEEEAAQPLFAVLRGIADVIARLLTGATTPPVSYTHLTLPTICSV